MLTKQDVDAWCRERGYSLHMRSGDGLWLSYSKDFDRFHLTLTVDLAKKEGQLQAFPGMFTLSSGHLQFPHPHFEMFENRMAVMMTAIENNNTTLL